MLRGLLAAQGPKVPQGLSERPESVRIAGQAPGEEAAVMLTITLQVGAPPGQAIGVKEDIAMRLEPLGDVRVVSITEDTPEQLHVEGYKGPQDAPRRKEA